MTLKDLMEEQARNTERWFPNAVGDLRHMALGLAGEAGEVANIVKKIDRGDFKWDDPMYSDATVRESLADEVTDVLVYVLNLYKIIGLDPDELLKSKTEYNRQRFGGRNV